MRSHHPHFKATSDIGRAKTRFTNAVLHARPAFQQFYRQCIKGYSQSLESQFAVLDVFETVPDAVNIEPDKREAMRKHGASAFANSTVAERMASALLQQSAELVESLVYELTRATKPIGVGIATHGVPLDEALKACGNYTRHRAEWVMVDRTSGTLRTEQYASVRVIAQLIDKKPPLTPKDSLDTLMLWSEPMRMCLYSICDLRTHPKRRYAYLEQRLIDCGRTIIDKCW